MPFVSKAQRRWMFAKKPAMAREWASKTTKGAKLPEHVKKSKVKKYKIAINNKIKSYGSMDPKTNKIVINVKSHKGDKAELASTIKHEMMHVTHPHMTEKQVYKKTAKTKIPEAEQNKLIAKLKNKTRNYKVGALKRKYKLGRGDVEPGTFINKINSQKAENVKDGLPKNSSERTAIMGAV